MAKIDVKRQRFGAASLRRPNVDIDDSTIISVYLPERLRRELVREAKARDSSVNAVVVERLMGR